MDPFSEPYEIELVPNEDMPADTPIVMLINQLVESANLCMNGYLLIPALILMFSTIDILAGLDSSLQGERKVRDRFEGWVRRYFPQGISLDCSPTDLYSARCGLAHSFSADSDLTESGGAKKVVYAMHETEAEKLRSALKDCGRDELRVLVVERLAACLSEAIRGFIERLRHDPESLEWANAESEGVLLAWKLPCNTRGRDEKR